MKKEEMRKLVEKAIRNAETAKVMLRFCAENEFEKPGQNLETCERTAQRAINELEKNVKELYSLAMDTES